MIGDSYNIIYEKIFHLKGYLVQIIISTPTMYKELHILNAIFSVTLN